MNKPTANANQRNSRLVTSLSAIGVSAPSTSHSQFIRKLAELFDLSYSVTFSTLMRQLGQLSHKQGDIGEGQREQVLALRQELVTFIHDAFLPTGGNRDFTPPIATANAAEDAEASLKPYQRYYALLQSELEYRLHRQRVQLRQALSCTSHRGMQLATLDAALDKILSSDSRKLMASLPRHLSHSYHRHLGRCQTDQTAQDLDSIATEHHPQPPWVAPFTSDMKDLLLAELDTRLQPVLGLLEALEEELEHTL